MSIDQLAAATKIPRRSLELLEEDRYDALPGPVFAKGFLRCAARALGVDVQTVMDLLFERERAALSARRRDRPPTAPAMVADEFAPRRAESRDRVETRTEARARTRASASERDAAEELAERSADASAPEVAPRRVAEGSKRRPPRLRARATAGPSIKDRVRARLPSPALFLWVVVAAFVAMVVLAAFNLVGGGATGGPS
jgi:hypothetical protein